MIFVAVGTQKFQFNRLLEEIDSLIGCAAINEEVFAQIGYSDYTPYNYEYRNFLSKKDFASCVAECDLLITHSGVATIMMGLKYNKPIIVVPRLAKFGEHVDDHQLEIATIFNEKNLVCCCNENNKLLEIIKEAKIEKFDKYESSTEHIILIIRNFLEGC